MVVVACVCYLSTREAEVMGEFKFSLSHKVSLQPAWNTWLQTYYHSLTENPNHENLK